MVLVNIEMSGVNFIDVQYRAGKYKPPQLPFVAVDQIQHGQKVTHVLRKLRWPYCFVANEIGQRELEAAARDALHEGFRPTLERMRKSAIQMANDTLATVCDTVVDAAFKA